MNAKPVSIPVILMQLVTILVAATHVLVTPVTQAMEQYAQVYNTFMLGNREY